MATQSQALQEMLDRILLLMTTFEGLQAVGLAGSHAVQTADDLSDVDLIVYGAKVPPGEVRLRQYRDADVGEVRVFDRELGLLREDLLRIDGRLVSLGWLAVPDAERFLRNLIRDFDCDESLPGGLLATTPLYDPGKTLERLQREVPEYSTERAVHRVRRALQATQLEFEELRRLEAAVLREDCYYFLKVQQELLDYFFRGVFALNRAWLSGEKRLIERAREFRLAPANVAEQLRDLVMRAGACSDLAGAYDAAQTLFADLKAVAREELGDAVLPVS